MKYAKGQFGFFDPGSSDRSSLSLWFRFGSPDVNTPLSALLPKHRTWSGGLLFTLPEDSLVGPIADSNHT
jgi:hypothetical protein